MVVVINEFEVVAEAPPAGQQPAQAAQESPKEMKPTPHEVERLLRWQEQRLDRVRAH